MSVKNKVQLIGNVGQELEINNSSSGKKVVRFSLATNESYKKESGEKVTKTEWHRLVCFNKTADLAEQLITKGQQLAVEGKLTYNSYEDKEGIKRLSTDIIVNEFLLLTPKSNQEQS